MYSRYSSAKASTDGDMLATSCCMSSKASSIRCGGQRGVAMDMLTNPEMKSSINHHHLFVAIINITIIIIAASMDRVVGINLSTILTDKGHTYKFNLVVSDCDPFYLFYLKYTIF